jgi:hypothetical protein
VADHAATHRRAPPGSGRGGHLRRSGWRVEHLSLGLSFARRRGRAPLSIMSVGRRPCGAGRGGAPRKISTAEFLMPWRLGSSIAAPQDAAKTYSFREVPARSPIGRPGRKLRVCRYPRAERRGNLRPRGDQRIRQGAAARISCRFSCGEPQCHRSRFPHGS